MSSRRKPAKGLPEPLLSLPAQRTGWKLVQELGAQALATLQDGKVFWVVLQLGQEAIELPVQPVPAVGKAGA